MVLTEAFAAGTPVVASDIAGYRDVVDRRRRRRCSSRAATPSRSAETLRDLALDRARGSSGSARARRPRAERYAWPRVAEQVVEAYEDARAVPGPRARARARPCASASARPTAARARPRGGCRSLDPRPTRAARVGRLARRAAPLARRRRRGGWRAARGRSTSGWDAIGDALVRSSPAWVLVGARADVRLDGRCARSPGTRSCKRRAAGGARRASSTPSRARRSAC